MKVDCNAYRSFASHASVVAAGFLLFCLLASGSTSAKSITPASQRSTVDGVCSTGAGGLDVRELKPNISVPREISGGKSHYYKFEVRGNAYSHAVVDQRGIDV